MRNGRKSTTFILTLLIRKKSISASESFCFSFFWMNSAKNILRSGGKSWKAPLYIQSCSTFYSYPYTFIHREEEVLKSSNFNPTLLTRDKGHFYMHKIAAEMKIIRQTSIAISNIHISFTLIGHSNDPLYIGIVWPSFLFL